MSLRIAIVGCGKIADSHVAQIRRLPGCDIVGVCDREPLMARQLAQRFGIARHFEDVGSLLAEAAPDVVHITTPPQSHFEIARQCLEHGAHLYVEKPFTLNAVDAEELIALANQRRRQLTVGHDAQFSHAARRLRALVRRGYLGESIVHMESYYGYDLGNATYARALLQDHDHWVRQLPGGLLQNVISHGLARIAELLRGDRARVIAHAFVSPRLRALGVEDVYDELRVIIVDEYQTTASFTFSSQARPVLNQFRAFGSKNGLALDERQQTVVKLRGAAFKSYAEQFVPPVLFAKQYVGNAAHNARLFLTNDFHMDAGKKHLIEALYRSIVKGGPAPIPSREIVMTARLMDSIVEQLQDSASPARRKEGVSC